MSALAALLIALRRDRNLAALADSHSHRATLEDSLGIIRGRDAITAAWVKEDASDVTITADLGDMIAYQIDGRVGHRWAWREGARIVREIVIEDRGAAKIAVPAHPPLGELRAGQGQYAAGDAALLPSGFSEGARAVADRLHRAWNGRDFSLYDKPWLPALIRQLPDASFYFEHAIIGETQTAILWRVHGHHASGQRVRLIGSSIVTGADNESVIDHAAMAAQIVRETLSYA